eukprot:GHRQ01028047.1.p1 GENE.GHRQ01028047.1~~GHRQ01028047.1.p1  ORF type:complete len:121 (-),score=2.68 GHRQ01028047.1:298-660(-)
MSQTRCSWQSTVVLRLAARAHLHIAPQTVSTTCVTSVVCVGSACEAAGAGTSRRLLLTLVSVFEPVGEDGPQRVGYAQHHLSEAARQHPDEVLILRHVFVHTAVVVVEASLTEHNNTGLS